MEHFSWIIARVLQHQYGHEPYRTLSQPQAISGLGGIGKTQLALEYAYRYHQDYTAVLWARAESTEALVSSYIALATVLHLPEQGALLLLRRAGLITPDAELSQASAQERDLVLQISQELGGLPLALDQAGAYLEATGTDLADYWHLYQQHRADLLRERRALIPDHPAPVATNLVALFSKRQREELSCRRAAVCVCISFS